MLLCHLSAFWKVSVVLSVGLLAVCQVFSSSYHENVAVVDVVKGVCVFISWAVPCVTFSNPKMSKC